MTQDARPARRTRFPAVLAALAVVGCATLGGDPGQPLVPTRFETRTGPFAVFTNTAIPADAPEIRSLRSLERDLTTSLGIRVAPDGPRIEVYILKDREAFTHFLTFYYPELPPRRAFFLAQEPRRVIYAFHNERLEEDLRHEATHALLHVAFGDLPLWLDEGLAEYFEGPDGRQGLNPEHMARLPDDFANRLAARPGTARNAQERPRYVAPRLPRVVGLGPLPLERQSPRQGRAAGAARRRIDTFPRHRALVHASEPSRTHPLHCTGALDAPGSRAERAASRSGRDRSRGPLTRLSCFRTRRFQRRAGTSSDGSWRSWGWRGIRTVFSHAAHTMPEDSKPMRNEEAGRSEKRQGVRRFRGFSVIPSFLSSFLPEFRAQTKCKPLWGTLISPIREAYVAFFTATGNSLILAARMKSFSERPPIAWVQISTVTFR